MGPPRAPESIVEPAPRAVRRILPHRTKHDEVDRLFFYELHEGDDEVYSDLLVVSESEWEPEEFFDLVQRIRHDVQDGYEQDTLIEAIAIVLERDYGFIYVSDDQLAAAVNVSRLENDNFLTRLETDEDDEDEDDAERQDQGELSGDFRTILAEFDPDRERLN